MTTIEPVDGVPYGEKGSAQKKMWNKNNWAIQSLPNISNGYSEKFEKTDSVVVHKIFIENSGFSYVRKFRLINCVWNLVYIEDNNY